MQRSMTASAARLVAVLAALALTIPACSRSSDAPATAGESTDQPPREREVRTIVPKIELPLPEGEVRELSDRILKAYRARDLKTLTDLGPERAKEILIFLEPRNPNYEELLGDSSWRMQALRAWDGEVIALRAGIDVIKVRFHDIDETTTAVLEIIPEGERWVFHDLVQEPRTAWADGG